MPQAIIWAKGGQDLGRYSTSLGHNELSGMSSLCVYYSSQTPPKSTSDSHLNPALEMWIWILSHWSNRLE